MYRRVRMICWIVSLPCLTCPSLIGHCNESLAYMLSFDKYSCCQYKKRSGDSRNSSGGYKRLLLLLYSHAKNWIRSIRLDTSRFVVYICLGFPTPSYISSLDRGFFPRELLSLFEYNFRMRRSKSNGTKLFSTYPAVENLGLKDQETHSRSLGLTIVKADTNLSPLRPQ